MSSPMPVADRLRTITLVASGFCGVACVIALVVVLQHGDRTRTFGWSATQHTDAGFILRVIPNGPVANTLRSGDLVVALNGDRRVERWRPEVLRQFIPGDTPYSITVRRGAEEQTFSLQPLAGRSAIQYRLCLSLVFVAAAWCAFATLLALRRMDQPVARVAAAAGLLLSGFFVAAALRPMDAWLSPWLQLFHRAMVPISPLHLAVGFDFYVRFPRDAPPPRLLRWLRAGLYLVCSALALVTNIPDLVLFALGPDRYAAAQGIRGALGAWPSEIGVVVQVATGIGILAALIYNYRHVRSEDDRRRLRWTVWGTVAGISPFALSTILQAIASFAPGLRSSTTAMIVPANIATIAIPISFGYAIVKHQVFDITFVVRRGLQYLLARHALRALIFLPLAAVAYGLVIHRDQPVGRILANNSIYLYLIVAGGISLRYRTDMMRWLDRRFFREAYARERILVELVEHVGQLDSAASVSKLVSQEIEAAFHPQSLFIWYRDAERPHLTLSYSSGGTIHTAELGPGAPLARLAENAGGFVDVRTADSALVAALPDADRAWLSDAGVRLIVPMTTGDRHLAGLLMLGDKKSDEPYSSDDLTLLQAIARQVALARENARLKNRVDDDRRVRHEVIAKLDPSRVNLLKECPRCGACYDATASACQADGAELTLSLPVERTLDGKYRLDRLIGKGGMGAVYEATDLRLVRPVAVKILLGRAFGDRQALRRFEREAQTSARLAHPNVVTVYDFGTAGAEGAFIAMELVRGTTLRAELQAQGARPPGLAADWFEQIGAGVGAAHAQHIIHRDLKPENVIITRRPGEPDRLKVVDFGLAKIQTADRDETGAVTHTGTVMGTAGYMAPEQLSGGETDERADVFALGVMVVEAITGTRPFDAGTSADRLVALLQVPIQLPGDAHAWRLLEHALQRALAREPRDRYQHAGEFVEHIVPALRQIPGPAAG